MNTPYVPLHTVCVQDRTSVRPGERGDLPYLGLEGIEAGTGLFIRGALSKTPETPLANSFLFDSRHVLYGKLRPYLNKVALPDAQGKCSTEIVPLLPAPELDRRYLAYFLRSQWTITQITDRSAGARMPRADMEFLLSLRIPLRPLAEQRIIVDLLSRAEGLVRLRREAQHNAAQLIPAIFIDMFGDPATNPNKWIARSLGDVICGGPINGLYKHKSAYGAGTPILRIDCFYDGIVKNLDNFKRVQLDSEEELRRFALAKEDIVINRVNSPEYLGKSAIIPSLTEPTVFESNMMRFSVDRSRVLPEFLIALLQHPSSRRHLLSNAKHAINQSSINQQDVKSLPIVVPPIALQAEFVRNAQAVQSILDQQGNSERKSMATFDALLSQSFL